MRQVRAFYTLESLLRQPLMRPNVMVPPPFPSLGILPFHTLRIGNQACPFFPNQRYTTPEISKNRNKKSIILQIKKNSEREKKPPLSLSLSLCFNSLSPAGTRKKGSPCVKCVSNMHRAISQSPAKQHMDESSRHILYAQISPSIYPHTNSLLTYR